MTGATRYDLYRNICPNPGGCEEPPHVLKYSGTALTFLDNEIICGNKFSNFAVTYGVRAIYNAEVQSGFSNYKTYYTQLDWKRNISLEEDEIPTETRLLENYPNPFNPVTVIRYTLSEDSYVTLKVYNTLGKEVATLINGMQSAGYKMQEWNAGGFPSGIYFYRLTAGSLSDMKKMILTR